MSQEALAASTTWHVGGTARFVWKPEGVDACARGMVAMQRPVVWLGLGSNVLLPDGTLDATVVMTRPGLCGMVRLRPGVFRAEAGVACAKLAKWATRDGCCEASFFAGIPGTVGGALWMNAGAWGGETWRHLTRLWVLHEGGEVGTYLPSDFEVGYRCLRRRPPGFLGFLAAEWAFPCDGTSEQAVQTLKSWLKARQRSQPIGTQNAGSVFRNPPGHHAGALLEAVGMKGYCVGGAGYAEKHANFIINHDHASAHDIQRLMAEGYARVKERFGVCLDLETCVYHAAGHVMTAADLLNTL